MTFSHSTPLIIGILGYFVGVCRTGQMLPDVSLSPSFKSTQYFFQPLIIQNERTSPKIYGDFRRVRRGVGGDAFGDAFLNG